jgi:hypothetical protein
MSHSTTTRSVCCANTDPAARKLAAGLGCFSIALGVVELVATRCLTNILGMRGKEDLLRAYGVREIATGIGILAAKDPTPWIWGRVAGDALDLATLAGYCTDDSPEPENAGIAILNVAAVTALDVYCARKLSQEGRGYGRGNEQPPRDFSDRSGFPRPPEEMRGAAADFVIPEDMRAPDALQPRDGKAQIG